MENTTTTTKFCDYDVIRRADGMINASEFLKRYNDVAKVKKRMDVFYRSCQIKRFINAGNLCELEKEKQEGCRPMKRTWWFNPLFFAEFAMWLDAGVRLNVLKYLVAKHENDAFDVYTRVVDELGIQDDKTKCEQFMKALDFVVFGKQEYDAWFFSSEEQRSELLKVLNECESDIRNGSDFNSCIEKLRDMYKVKYTK